MMSVAVLAPARIMPAMSPDRPDTANELRLLGRALALLRRRADLSQAAAAEKLGITPQAWQRYEAGDRQALLRTDLQERLTAALGFDRLRLAEELDSLRGDAAATRSATVHEFSGRSFSHLRQNGLPLRDAVRAGAWLAADDLSQEPPKFFPAARDPRFPTADQWVSQVYGDSMDLLHIVEGDVAQFVDAIQIGYAPRTGDVVEVERARSGGQLRELTIKQVDVGPDMSVTLWPRSANPRWQEPLRLDAGANPGEELEVRIRGLLVATIRRF